MKRLFLYMFFISIIMEYSYAESTDWPKQIIDTYVHMYVQDKDNLTEDKLKEEYEYILDFLDGAIISYKTNLANAYSEEITPRRYHFFLDGQLIFKDDLRYITVWDPEKGEFINVNHIEGVVEMMDLIEVLETYNQLIEHWFLRSGELLRGKYDRKKELDNAVFLFNSRLNSREW